MVCSCYMMWWDTMTLLHKQVALTWWHVLLCEFEGQNEQVLALICCNSGKHLEMSMRSLFVRSVTAKMLRRRSCESFCTDSIVWILFICNSPECHNLAFGMQEAPFQFEQRSTKLERWLVANYLMVRSSCDKIRYSCVVDHCVQGIANLHRNKRLVSAHLTLRQAESLQVRLLTQAYNWPSAKVNSVQSQLPESSTVLSPKLQEHGPWQFH